MASRLEEVAARVELLFAKGGPIYDLLVVRRVVEIREGEAIFGDFVRLMACSKTLLAIRRRVSVLVVLRNHFKIRHYSDEPCWPFNLPRQVSNCCFSAAFTDSCSVDTVLRAKHTKPGCDRWCCTEKDTMVSRFVCYTCRIEFDAPDQSALFVSVKCPRACNTVPLLQHYTAAYLAYMQEHPQRDYRYPYVQNL